MNDLDRLIKDELVPLRKRAIESFAQKYPDIMTLFNSYLAGQKNMVGMRVTENGETVGEYTIYLEGIDITKVESGVLLSGLHLPFGIIRPYAVIERSALERMLDDEENVILDPLRAISKHLPDLTLKFM